MGIFYKNLVVLCSKHGVTPSGVAKAIGLSNAAATGWKKGKTPSDVTLQKISMYFGVTPEFLLEDANKKENPATPESSGEPDKYSMLNDENREFIDKMIAKLLASQSPSE